METNLAPKGWETGMGASFTGLRIFNSLGEGKARPVYLYGAFHMQRQFNVLYKDKGNNNTIIKIIENKKT